MARERSLAKASAHLRRAQPTISAKVGLLEPALDEKLFPSVGRGLAPTDTGASCWSWVSWTTCPS